jgi:hypothetical protein
LRYKKILRWSRFTLDFTKLAHTNLTAEDWCDEVEKDIVFLMVDINKVKLKDGFSSTEMENPYMCSLMNVEVVADALWNHENKKAAGELWEDAGTQNKKKEVASDDDAWCALCGNIPCVWLGERGNIIMNDKVEYEHTFGIAENRSRHSMAFCYMFRIINGGEGKKGVRK